MAFLMIVICIIGQPEHGEDDTFSPGFRFGPCFIASFPSMQNEKDFAEMNTEAGLDFELSTVAWGGSIEVLVDASERIKVRGSLGVSRVNGAYTDEYDPMSYILVGILTGGFGFLFGSTEDVIDLNDQAISAEAEVYYVLSRGKSFSFSAGAGPVYTWASRSLDSPNTSTKGNGSAFGLVTSLRLDQESSFKLGCIPMMFGFEAGYRMNSVKLDDDESDRYELDFSGPFVKIGSYLSF